MRSFVLIYTPVGHLDIALLKNLPILFLAVLGLRYCTWAFSSCSEWAALCVAHWLFIAVASLAVELGRYGARSSAIAACGLGSCGSQALEHGPRNCVAQA